MDTQDARNAVDRKPFLDAQLLAALNYPCGVALKRAVNLAIECGYWCDGFEAAVCAGDLPRSEIEPLLQIAAKAFPETAIDKKQFKSLLQQHLPQSSLGSVSWVIADDLTIIAEDGLRVARLTLDSCIWVSPRISFDDIKITKVTKEHVHGFAWLLRANNEMDPFTLSFLDGSPITGSIFDGLVI